MFTSILLQPHYIMLSIAKGLLRFIYDTIADYETGIYIIVHVVKR